MADTIQIVTIYNCFVLPLILDARAFVHEVSLLITLAK